MKNISYIEERSKIIFPENTGERVYMLEFYKANGLPANLSRWQAAVDQMLDGVETDGPIYLMIDQGFVKAGEIQRKGGVHIDGYWQPSLSTHGTSSNSHNHDPMPSSHSHSPPTPSHGHTPEMPSSHSHSPTYDSHHHNPLPTIPSSHSHAPVHHRHDPMILIDIVHHQVIVIHQLVFQ